MKHLIAALLTIAMLGSTLTAYAHSGRTNKNGCHNDRKNGTYHCH